MNLQTSRNQESLWIGFNAGSERFRTPTTFNKPIHSLERTRKGHSIRLGVTGLLSKMFSVKVFAFPAQFSVCAQETP